MERIFGWNYISGCYSIVSYGFLYELITVLVLWLWDFLFWNWLPVVISSHWVWSNYEWAKGFGSKLMRMIWHFRSIIKKVITIIFQQPRDFVRMSLKFNDISNKDWFTNNSNRSTKPMIKYVLLFLVDHIHFALTYPSWRLITFVKIFT